MAKDQSKLFENVSEDVYQKTFRILEVMRSAHPGYRDDQLLMKLLCDLAHYRISADEILP